MSVLEPNAERLRATLAAFAAPEVGGTANGGVSRPAASDADKAARDLFADLARGAGLTVRVDDVGNMYARREGRQPDALPVLIGSHLDTVTPGGRFDGILGVAIALETAALINETGARTLRSLEVVNWMGEEGARFPPAMLGSGAVAGIWDAGYVHASVDNDGRRLGEELARIGYAGSAENRIRAFFASLEAHIEQGSQLDDAGTDLGIVTGVTPVRWSAVRVTGHGGHAGGAGPSGRTESMVAAARMIVAARDASAEAGDFTTMVGRIAVEPGSSNVIPHLVTFNLDLRSTDDATADRHLDELTVLFEQIAAEEGVDVFVDRYWSMPGTRFDEHIQALLRRVAGDRGVNWMPTPGRIGHDSLYVARMGPTAMLFARTRDGLSHCEEEFAPWESVLATAGVFANATFALANAESLAEVAPVVGR